MPETKRFQRKVESFVCVACGKETKGTGITDHCPYCLASVHVDVNPGDRASKCRGLMIPQRAEYSGGSYTIVYQCLKCGEVKRVVAAPNDNEELLAQLSEKAAAI